MHSSSDRDDLLVRWIDAFLDEKGYAPAVREIGQAFDLASSASVKSWLDRLRKEGRVTWVEGQTRTLHTVKEIADEHNA